MASVESENRQDMEKAIASLSLKHKLFSPLKAKGIIEEARTAGKNPLHVALEAVSNIDILKATAQELRVVFFDLNANENPQGYRIDTDVLARADIETLRRFIALPMVDRNQKITIAIAMPNSDLINYFKKIYPEEFKLMFSPKDQLQDRLAVYSADNAAAALADSLGIINPSPVQAAASANLPRRAGPKNPVIEFVDAAFARAVAAGASDIHFQYNTDKSLQIRFRIDGILIRQRLALPGREPEIIGALLSKSATMDATNLLEPQDGTLSFEASSRQIDARISMLPQINGPKVVVRLLDSKNLDSRLDDMGFETHSLGVMRRALNQAQGTVIVCGPTGSGKSTTLYGLLKEADAETKSVVTVEDPVEYKLPNISQTPIRTDLGQRSITFPRALRSILRQDPDIILVGEIRDTETAKVAMDAAITGHLVLTTTHAPSAIGVYTRLSEMNVPAYMVAEALSVVVSQRLLRKLHDCRRIEIPTLEEKNWFISLGNDVPEKVAHPAGCQGCNNSGFRGRLATAEVLVPTRNFKTLAASGATYEELHSRAIEDGFKPIIYDGLRHVLNNETTVSEVVRVLSSFTEEY